MSESDASVSESPEPQPEPARDGPDLARLVEAVDGVLEVVREWAPGEQGPEVSDWNDLFLVAAFTRGYRCLRSARELAVRGEADDVAVLARALVALTLRYLWLGRAQGDDERRDRLRRLEKKWVADRATLGEQLEALGYLRQGTSAQHRARADALAGENVGGMPPDSSIAELLDQELQPKEPTLFELVYARVYRWTSEIAHYGLGAALDGFVEPPIGGPGMLEIDRRDEKGAAGALGLALVTFAALADFGEPVVRHGLTARIEELVRAGFGKGGTRRGPP